MNFSDKKLGFVDYVFTLTDDVGILQHSVYGIPDPRRDILLTIIPER